MPISTTGVWIDDASGEVVFEQPRGRGTQLVAKGSEISKAARTRAQSLGATIPDDHEPAAATAEKTGDAADAVTTEDVAPAKAKRSAKG